MKDKTKDQLLKEIEQRVKVAKLEKSESNLLTPDFLPYKQEQEGKRVSGNKEKVFNIGCDNYISKPIKKEKLMALIQKYFNK